MRTECRIFADSSSIAEIEKLDDTGLIYGITTNPLIVAKEANGKDPTEYYRNLSARFSNLPVSIQLLEGTAEDLIRQGQSYASLGENIVIKIPMFGDGRGLRVISHLMRDGIKVNVTGLMNTDQLLLALLAGQNQSAKGPSYVSLFYNRILDGGGDPHIEISRSREWIDKKEFGSEIIVGSIRKGSDVSNAFLYGAHIVTVTPKIFWSMIYQEQSERFISQCQEDWITFTK